MTTHSYLLFVSSSVALALIPGPDMAYMLARCIAQGRGAGVLAALGFNASSYVFLAAAVLGLSAVLAASPLAFDVIKWLGAAYLVYLGISAMRSGQRVLDVNGVSAAKRTHRAIFWQAFATDLLNPKVIMFFFAFLPQFVDPQAAHPTLQLVSLGVTVNMICLLINILLVTCSAKLTEALRRNASISNWLHRGMGALFVALGLRLAVQRM
ncbi:MAG TPA: LysE family translocator [Steroidobacteraceae bacterium]|jgi:threonine/homoserine/homoserine lactone efflux protein